MSAEGESVTETTFFRWEEMTELLYIIVVCIVIASCACMVKFMYGFP